MESSRSGTEPERRGEPLGDLRIIDVQQQLLLALSVGMLPTALRRRRLAMLPFNSRSSPAGAGCRRIR